MRINHNTAAMNTYSKLSSAQGAQAKSLEKLSSGLRINRAGDDAAGLAISEKMRGQISGLNQATSNAQDGISLIQTAEGGLNETHSILQRMRELAVQSANDTNTDTDRGEIQKEMNQLSEEVSRISSNTQFNSKNLLDGEFSAKFHIGANKGQNMELKVSDMSAKALNVSGKGGLFEQAGTSVGDVALADVAQSSIALAISGTGSTASADISLKADKLENSIVNGTDTYEYALKSDAGDVVALSTDGKEYTFLKTEVVEANIVAADIGAHKVSFGDNKVTSGNVTAVTTSGNADELASFTVSAEKVSVQLSEDASLKSGTYTVVDDSMNANVASGQFALQDSDGNLVAHSVDGLEFNSFSDLSQNVFNAATQLTAGNAVKVEGPGGINVSSQESANIAIETIDNAISTVSAERSKLGAVQNRLDHTINNLTTTSENLSAAESRIRDVDMAKEMMEFTKNNILNQASTAMLAQANQMPQGVLQLLG